MNPVSFICFDFDGTIVDSVGLFSEKLNQLAPEFGFAPVSREESERLRKSDPVRILEMLKIPECRLPVLADRLRTELGKEIGRMAPFEGIPEALAVLRDRELHFGLVTSNSEENVRSFLEFNRMPAFEFFECGCSLQGKADAIGKLMVKTRITPGEMVYIGDEVRDAKAARNVGVRFGAVSWGFYALERLIVYHPDYVFRKPGDIPRILS